MSVQFYACPDHTIPAPAEPVEATATGKVSVSLSDHGKNRSAHVQVVMSPAECRQFELQLRAARKAAKEAKAKEA